MKRASQNGIARVVLLAGLPLACAAVLRGGAGLAARAVRPGGGAASGKPRPVHLLAAGEGDGDRGAFRSPKALDIQCGAAPAYKHAAPKNYADSRPTFYNKTSKKTEDVTFKPDDSIEYRCKDGFTTDGSKAGPTEFTVMCTEHGYYKPGGVCLAASACGPLPNISHAAPTGKTTKAGAAELACSRGYSLDGKEVLEGGLGKNRFFRLQCVEHSGTYENFEGECKPYAFVPEGEVVRIYHEVFGALFVVSCEGSLKTAFARKELPGTLSETCGTFEESATTCDGLVTEIKAKFADELVNREAAKKKLDDLEEGVDLPNIDEEARAFCTGLWDLLKLPG